MGAGGGIHPPEPPVFLSGPMALLLTNADGFRARVTLETRSSSNRLAALPGRRSGLEVLAGELLGRGSKLLFTSGAGGSGGKGAGAGANTFIWDVAQNRGFILSEPLQGYAPISSSARFTNLVLKTRPDNSTPRKVAGQRCDPQEAIVTSSDGVAAVFQVWRAADLKGLPLQISSAAGPATISLSFSKIRLEVPPSDVFLPPDSFTKYDNPEAMMTELAARQQDIRRTGTGASDRTAQRERPEERSGRGYRGGP